MITHYKPITARADRVLIVATGPSVEGVDLTVVGEDVHIIAVNGAIEWLPWADSFFSLDPSPIVRRLVSAPRKSCKYYLAVPDDYGQPGARILSHRAKPDAHVQYLRRVSGIGPHRACYSLSEDKAAIHTGNSAWGALGLAYHMEPRKIALLGVDATRDRYAYKPNRRPHQNFHFLPDLFASALQQLRLRDIEVLNGSAESNVLCFPKCRPEYAIDWLSEECEAAI